MGARRATPFNAGIRGILLSLTIVLFAHIVLFADTAFAQEEQTANARDFNTAARLQNLGKYERAAQRWQQFLKDYPESERKAEVYNHLATCQLQLRQFAEAEKTLQTLLEEHPKFKQLDAAHYNLGMAQFQRGKADKNADLVKTAAQTLGQVAEKFKESRLAPKALYFQAEALYAAEDAAGAVEAYKKLAQNYPQHLLAPQALYYLGVTQEELEQTEEAAQTYAKFLANGEYAQHELADEIRLRRAMILHAQRSYDEAEELFAQVAQKEDGEFADFALLRRAQCQLAAGKPEAAVGTLEEMQERYGESPYRTAAQLAEGKARFRLEDWEEARKALESAKNSNNAQPAEAAEASYWLSRTLLKQEKPDEAADILSTATQKFADTQFAPYLQLARADALYAQPESRQEARKAYADFAEQHPEHNLAAQARYMFSLAALGQQDYAAARQAADDFLADGQLQKHRLAPEMRFIAAEARLLDPERDEQMIQQALEGFRKLVNDHPDHSRAARSHLRIAACSSQLNRPDEVISHLKGSLNQFEKKQHEAEAHLLLGQAFAELDRHEEAVKEFDDALKADGEWAQADDAHLAAAQSLLALDQPEEARQRLETIVKQYGERETRAQAEFQLGEIAAQLGNLDEADKRFKNVLDDFADGAWAPPARMGLANVYLQTGEPAKAVEQLNKLLDGQPKEDLKAQALFLRGLAHRELEKFDHAVNDLSAFLKTGPGEQQAADAQFELALAQIGQEKFADAASTLRQLVQERGQTEEAQHYRYELAHALSSAGQAEQAAAAFRELAESHPDSPYAAEGWFRVGAWHEQQAENLDGEERKPEWTAALGAFQKGLNAALADGDDPSPLAEKLAYKLGDMQFRLEQYDQAAQTLLASLDRFPNGELAGLTQFLAAESLFRQKQFKQALPLFVEVAKKEVEPYEAQALYRAGTAAAELNDYQSSEKHFTTLLKQFPDFDQAADARYGLAVAVRKRGDLDEAVKLFEQVTEETESETAAKARYGIGEIAFERRDFDTAIEHYVEAGGYPYPHWQGMSLLETARCLKESGQADAAISELEKMIQQHPEHVRIDDAKRLLADWKK